MVNRNLILFVMGIFLVNFVSAICTTPTAGTTYNTFTTFCNGTYDINGTGLIVDGAVATCNNTIFRGNGSDYQVISLYPNSILENCIFTGNGGSSQMVWLGLGGNMTLRNNSFYNSTTSSSVAMGDGGASDGDATVISSYFENVFTAFYAFNITSRLINFSGNRILHSAKGVELTDEGNGGVNYNVTIANNVFTNTTKDAIYLYNAGYNSIYSNNISLTGSTTTYLYRTDKSVVNVSGRICNNSYAYGNATFFVYSDGNGQDVTTNNFLLSANTDNGANNFGVACLDLTEASGLDNTTVYYDTTALGGLSDCASIESAFGLSAGKCYFANPKALLSNGVGQNYTFNASVFNSTINISSGYLQPRMTAEIGIFYGIKSVDSGYNLIYNNYLNNTNNVYDNLALNYWNTTKTLGTNIIGGMYIGGNFFSDYSGQDTDGDGIGSTSYSIQPAGGLYDLLPLTNNETVKPYFITIPNNITVAYKEDISVQFNATDNLAFDSYAVNDSRFDISDGLLEDNVNLPVGLILLNITINDSLNNVNSTIFSVNVTKATGIVYTYINASRANLTISNSTQILLNTTLSTGSGNVLLYQNGTLIFNGTTPYAGNYSNFTAEASYNITSIYAGNENYSSSSETFYVTSDGTAPTLSLASSGSTTTTLTMSSSCTDTNSGVLTCVLSSSAGSVSGSEITGLSCGTTYSITLTGTDSVGNSGTTSLDATTSACTSSGGGSGGGGTTSTSTTSITEGQLNEGYSRALGVNGKVSFNFESEIHSVGVLSLTSTTATIEIASTPQQVNLTVGEEKKFDLNSDGFFDLYVKLNSIENNKANIEIKKINEKIVQEVPEEISEEKSAEEIKEFVAKVERNKNIFWIALLVILVILFVYIAIHRRRKRKNR